MAANEQANQPERDALKELLEELRVIIPGAQVLFAFLLTAPLMNRFTELSQTQTRVYYLAFLASALSVVLLIAPTMAHRLRSDGNQLNSLLKLSTALASGGVACLALAVSAVVYLNSDLLYRSSWSALAGAVFAGVCAWFWFGLPLLRRLRAEPQRSGQARRTEQRERAAGD
jgi:hypothetical protein